MIDEFITSIFGVIDIPDVLYAVVVFFIFAFAFEGLTDVMKSILKAGRL